MLLQLVYVSSVPRGAEPLDMHQILHVSRRNNARDRISGLLYADGQRFLQALEGPEAAVEAAFRRIAGDPRHHAIVTLSRRQVERREFGHWEMAHRVPGADAEAFLGSVDDLCRQASPDVRATFVGFIEARHPA